MLALGGMEILKLSLKISTKEKLLVDLNLYGPDMIIISHMKKLLKERI